MRLVKTTWLRKIYLAIKCQIELVVASRCIEVHNPKRWQKRKRIGFILQCSPKGELLGIMKTGHSNIIWIKFNHSRIKLNQSIPIKRMKISCRELSLCWTKCISRGRSMHILSSILWNRVRWQGENNHLKATNKGPLNQRLLLRTHTLILNLPR